MNEACNNDDELIAAVQRWLETAVIGLNLCPFAAAPFKAGRIRFRVCREHDIDALLLEIYAEMSLLWDKAPELVETSIIICPTLSPSFDRYLDCLDAAQALLEQSDWCDELQIASFHPDYCFEGLDVGDSANYTNRAPHALFHLLREHSVSLAVAGFGDTSLIPERNIERMRSLSAAQLSALRCADE